MTKEINELLAIPSVVMMCALLFFMGVVDPNYFGKQLLIYTLCILIVKQSATVASGITALLMLIGLLAKHLL